MVSQLNYTFGARRTLALRSPVPVSWCVLGVVPVAVCPICVLCLCAGVWLVVLVVAVYRMRFCDAFQRLLFSKSARLMEERGCFKQPGANKPGRAIASANWFLSGFYLNENVYLCIFVLHEEWIHVHTTKPEHQPQNRLPECQGVFAICPQFVCATIGQCHVFVCLCNT